MSDSYRKKKSTLALLLDAEFIPSYSGAANRFHYLSRYLQKTGDIDIVVIVSDRGWCDLEAISQEPFTTYLVSPEQYYRQPEFIASLLKNECVNIIQCDNIEGSVFQGIQASHLTGAKLILEAHFDDLDFAMKVGEPEESLMYVKTLQTTFGRYMDAVIALSADEVHTIKNHLFIEKNRITAIPSGVDVHEIQPTPNAQTKRLVFLGNLYFEPNVRSLECLYTDIYQRLISTGYTFLIAGDAPKSVIARYQGDGFRFLGVVKDLNMLFQNASIAPCPIFDDPGMRIKILNYLAAGLPVITTKKGASGFPDKKQLIVENDIAKYPDLIESTLNNEDQYRRLSNQARIYAEKHLSWESIAQQAVEWYKIVTHRQTTNKEEAVKLLSDYQITEPAWLKEVVKKGRFSNMKSKISQGSYLKIKDGKIQTLIV